MNNQQITFYQKHKDYFKLCRETLMGNTVKTRNLIDNGVDVNICDARTNTPLHWAITKFEDLEIMLMLLDKGSDIHANNQHNYKPLHVAIYNNKTEAALLLIERGALVTGDLDSYLLMAIEKDNHTMVKMLIDHGMQYNSCIDLKTLNAAICRGHLEIIEHIIPYCKFSKSSDQYIPKELIIESGEQHRKCVKLLLKWNFNISPNSHQDEDFVYGAVKNGYLPIVLELLKLGIDVNMVNSRTKLNLLTIACLNEHHDIVENLLQHNADVNVTMPINSEIKNNLLCRHHICGVYITPTDTKTLENKRYIIHQYNQLISSKYNQKGLSGITCIHIAVLNSDPMMIKLLLKYGAMITDDPTFFNITCIAVQVNYEEIFRIFLEHGVNVNDIDAQGKSLLHFCVNTDVNRQDSRYNIAKLLLENGANIHIQAPGNTLVFEAMKNGYRNIAQLFLNYNADVQYISPDDDTLLHKAIEEGFDLKFIKSLLKLNSPVNYVNNNNKLTPLLVAYKTQSSNQIEIVKALLHYNVNVNCVDDNSMTPLHLECENKNLHLVKLLLKNGANPDAVNAVGQTPLHIICKHESKMTTRIIQVLLEYGANMEATDAKGWTPLFMAYETANHLAVKYLLDNGANVNHTDSEDGCTLLHIAVRRSLFDMASNLIKYGANVNVLDKKNQTPLQDAAKFRSLIFLSRREFQNHSIEERELIPATLKGHIDAPKKILSIIKILIKQVVQLKVAGLEVNEQNLVIVYRPGDYSDVKFSLNYQINCGEYVRLLEVECKEEIKKMKVERIGVYNMTLYDLMKKNIYMLSRFVKNKKVVQILERKVYNEKFPLYIDLVRSRFRDAKLRYKFTNAATKYFSANICNRLSDDCLDIVFSYLSIEEIEMFVRTMKLLDG